MTGTSLSFYWQSSFGTWVFYTLLTFCRYCLVIPFYIYVLLGILVRCQEIVYTNYAFLSKNIYNIQTKGYDDQSESESDTETVTGTEIERQEDLKDILEDAENNLKQVEKAIELDKIIPINRKHYNHHLNHIKEEFSSYFHKKWGSDVTKALEDVEAVLKE